MAIFGCDQGKPAKITLTPQQASTQMFTSSDADVRRLSIEKISGYDWGRKEPYLKAYGVLSQDSAPTVRSAAIVALGRAADGKYLGAVVAGLKDADGAVRWDAAKALDNMTGPAAVEPLKAATHDSSADVRAAASTALRHYPRRDVLDCLLAELDDEDFSVRYKAAASMRQLTGMNLPSDGDVWRRALAGKPNPFVPPLSPVRPWWDWSGRNQKAAPASQPSMG